MRSVCVVALHHGGNHFIHSTEETLSKDSIIIEFKKLGTNKNYRVKITELWGNKHKKTCRIDNHFFFKSGKKIMYVYTFYQTPSRLMH